MRALIVVALLCCGCYPDRQDIFIMGPQHKVEFRNTAVVERAYTVKKFRVTAYCPCGVCCGRWAGNGKTASGSSALLSGIAADPMLPYWTVLDVPGYGEAMVDDRGGKIRGNKLDVRLQSHKLARSWGAKYLAVKVYDNGR